MNPRSTRKRPREAARTARGASRPGFFRTVGIAIAAPVTVFLALGWATSDPSGGSEPIDAWRIGERTVSAGVEGLRLDIGPRPVSILHPIGAPGLRPALVAFDLFLRDPVEPTAQLLYRRAAAGEMDYRGRDFSSALDRAGWNRVTVSADDAPGLANADEIGVLLASPAPNAVILRGARVEGLSFGRRLRRMAQALLAAQPLVPSSINAVSSPRVAGRGFGFLLWAGGAIALAILLLRRFLLREPVALLPHAAVTLVVLYALADLRNGADLWTSAREAAARRIHSPALEEYLARREQVFPWFADAVRALHARVPPGGSAWFQVNGPPVVGEAVNRAWYYGQPARRAASLASADVALFWGFGGDPLAGRPGWVLAERAPGGLVVYERSR